MKVERHEMKKLVLAYEQRQEEEDYSGRRGLGAESEVITQVLSRGGWNRSRERSRAQI